MFASNYGDLKIVKYLVKHVADVNQPDKYGGTALMLASMRLDLDIVRFLVEEHGAHVNQTDNDGRTALMYASMRRHRLKIVKFLVDHGADVNKTDNEGKTALMLATDSRIIKYLYSFKKINKAPASRKKYYNQGDRCPICLDPLNNKNNVCIITPCDHVFHCECLDRYKQPICPICRKSIQSIETVSPDDLETMELEEYKNKAGFLLFGKKRKKKTTLRSLRSLMADIKFLLK
jgi:hypothetical protein